MRVETKKILMNVTAIGVAGLFRLGGKKRKMDLEDEKSDKVIDISGKICPYTVMETRDILKTLDPGQVLEVISDYKPAATESIPNFCQKKNYPIEIIDNADGTYRLLIKKEE